MEWTNKYGQVKDYLLERADETGQVPDALNEEPERPAHLQKVLELWYYLSNQRPMVGGGMGPPMPRPIPVADIYMTAPDWGIDPGYFLRVTMEGDALYIEHLMVTIERKAKDAMKKKK